MLIEKVKLSDLNPSPYNPRQITEDSFNGLKKSIELFGLVEPIILNKQTGNIVGGHQRYRVLESQGVEETEVVVVDLSPIDEKALNIALNNPHIQGEFTDNLQELLHELQTEIPIEFEELQLSELLEESGHDIDLSEVVEDEIPENAETRVKKGDIWILGEHRLLCGDSTEELNLLEILDGSKINLLLTDPPYGVSYADKNEFLNKADKGNSIQKPIENDHLDLEELKTKLKACFTNISKEMAKYNSYYLFAPPGGDILGMMVTMLDSGWYIKQVLCWVKNNHVLGRSDYNYKHEPIIYGWTQNGTHKFYGGHKTSVLEFDKPLKNDLHPTMKPIALLCELINNSSQIGELIFDPFLGSGSTLIACQQLNRKCYGIEISPEYCDIILQRWEDFTQEKAYLERNIYET